MTRTLYLYILKKFLLTFLVVTLSISLLIAMINIFELLDQISNQPVTFGQIFILDILQIPGHIEEIAIFLVMLSSMITLFSLSIRSEITVMRSSGASLLQILYPIISGALLLGLFMVLVFNPLAIRASKKFTLMEQKLIERDVNNLLDPQGGIWLKQPNMLVDDEEIIIRANKVYRKNLQMKDVNLWFFDRDHRFYKKIDAKQMFLLDGYWDLENVVINDQDNINQHKPELKIITNLKADFITKKILNNFEDVALFSVYDLPDLIVNLKDSGFSPRKFVVYYYSLLIKPLLFVAVSLIAAFFTINNVRNKNNIILFVAGIAVGLVLYISFIIINAFGSSGLIPTFLATWMVAIITLSISVLLIFRKEAKN
jgi:lipopolysaccharide export system permease protein